MKPSSLFLSKKFVQARAEHPTSKTPLKSAAGSAPVITRADSQNNSCSRGPWYKLHVWICLGWGGERGVGCIRALGSQTCNSMPLLQMVVFQKWIYPCIMEAEHASWTPVWHTCWRVICRLDVKWASDGNSFDWQTSDLRWDYRDMFISKVAFQTYTCH